MLGPMLGTLWTLGAEVVLLVATLGCGLGVTCRLRWSPIEKLCSAIGLSLVLFYLGSAAVYVLHLPTSAYQVLTGIAILLGVVHWRQWRQLLGDTQVRRAGAEFAVLLVWTLILLAMTRGYGGGNWSGDWIEHYERSVFFLDHEPTDRLFLGIYLLPARPPMMNLLGAWILGQFGHRYDVFQVAFAFWNLLVFFACWLIVRAMLARGVRRPGQGVLLCLMALSPFLMENATYTWTKSLASFYVIVGLWFYLRAWKKQDALRLAAAAAAFSAGILVHYSAAPYVVVIALHYLLVLARKRQERWKEMGIAAAIGGVLVGSWILWSASVYGVHTTMAANTTVTVSSKMSVSGNLWKVGCNLLWTTIPHPFHIGLNTFSVGFAQPSAWGFVRDYAFLCLQNTLVVGMGTLGGIVVTVELFRVLVLGRGRPSRRWFWLTLIVAGGVLAVATTPALGYFGDAHVCLAPLIYLGIALLGASFSTLVPWMRWAVVVGCMADFLVGILLHFSLQNWTPTFVGTIPAILDDMPSVQTVANCLQGINGGHVFFGTHFAGELLLLQGMLLGLCCALLYQLAAAVSASGRGRRLAGFAAVAVSVVVCGVVMIDELHRSPQPLVTTGQNSEAAAATVAGQPDSPQAHLELAMAQYSEGQFAASSQSATEALMLDPTDQRARFIERMNHVMDPRIPSPAGVAAADAYFADEQSYDARNALGSALWLSGHIERSVAYLTAAAEQEPAKPAAHVNLGVIAMQLGHDDVGAKYFAAAVRCAPDDPSFHYMLAVALRRSGDREGARRAVNDALALRRDYPEAKALLEQLGAP